MNTVTNINLAYQSHDTNPINFLTKFIVSFCAQRYSPEYSLAMLDTKNQQGSWIKFSHVLTEIDRKTFLGVCGIYSFQHYIAFVTQSSPSYLVIVEIQNQKIIAAKSLKKCVDSHSIVYHENYIYVVSSGTNEIYRLQFINNTLGNEELFWRYPGVSYDKDEVHLNGLAIDNGNFIASCFGYRASDGTFTKDQGRIFYLNGKSIHEGLAQPHSPRVENQKLFFAESWRSNIYVYDKAGEEDWKIRTIFQIKGYLRGLTLNKNHLYIASSISRNISRSQLKKTEDLLSLSTSKLYTLDLDTGKVLSEDELLTYGREIYDINILLNTISLPSNSIMLSERAKAMEIIADSYFIETIELSHEKIKLKQQNETIISERDNLLQSQFNFRGFILYQISHLPSKIRVITFKSIYISVLIGRKLKKIFISIKGEEIAK